MVTSVYPSPLKLSSIIYLENVVVSYSELADAFAEMASTGDLQPRRSLVISCILSYVVTPPAELHAMVAEREKDDYCCESGSSVHCCLEEIWSFHISLVSRKVERKKRRVEGTDSCIASTMRMRGDG